MNAEMILYRMPPAREAGLTVPETGRAFTSLYDGKSLFQLLLSENLAQSLTPMAQTEMPDQGSWTEEGDMKEVFQGFTGLKLFEGRVLPQRIAEEADTMEQEIEAIEGTATNEEEQALIMVNTGMNPPEPVVPQPKPEEAVQGVILTEEAEWMPYKTQIRTEMPIEGRNAKAVPANLNEGWEGTEKPLENTELKMEPLKELPVQTAAAQDTGSPKPFAEAAEKIEPYSQVGREIQLKLEQKGPMEFKMQLIPKDLGQIDVRLKIDEGKLIIDIIAASSKTQSLLAGQADKLVMSMGLHDVQVEHVQVSQQGDLQSGERQQNHLQQQSENRQNTPDTPAMHYEGNESDCKESDCQDRMQKYNFVRMDYTI